MSDKRKAYAFAASWADRGEPHSGAIEMYGAVRVEGEDAFRIGAYIVRNEGPLGVSVGEAS